MKKTKKISSILLSVLLACALMPALAFTASPNVANAADNAGAKTLANDGYIEVDVSEIDGIQNMTFLSIQLRVATNNQKIFGLYTSTEPGGGGQVIPLKIGGKEIKTVPLSSGMTKTYRFVGNGNTNYPNGMQLSINGKKNTTEFIKSTIAIECGNETTGLTFDASQSTTSAGAAIALSNGAQVLMTLNNNVTVTSKEGYAGINVPNAGLTEVPVCRLDICGSKDKPENIPTLTAQAGIGGAGIGGNAGNSFHAYGEGETSGTISLYNYLVVNAIGGESDINHFGGAGIGGGGGYIGHEVGESGNGGFLELGTNSSGASTPLFVNATSPDGNDLGAAQGTGAESDKIIIKGGSIVADSFGVLPTDGSNSVYPVVIPKTSDVVPTTNLTGHLIFDVPVSSTTTYHAMSVASANPEHGNTFGYAAQLWLPEGFIVGIKGATFDKTVSIERGFVNVLPTLKPAFSVDENVVSFAAIFYKLTLDYAMPNSSLTPVIEDVAGGSIYTLPSKQEIHATWRLTGWSDGINTYSLRTDYTMPWEHTTLTGTWVQRTLEEILIPDKTDDLSTLQGNKNAQIGLDVELSELKEVGYANANGANYKPLTKDKEYRLGSGSTIITLQSTWLSTLKPDDYLLRVTYTDHSYDIPFTVQQSPTDPEVKDTDVSGSDSLAKTGDSANPFLPVFLGILALAALGVLRRRTKGTKA